MLRSHTRMNNERLGCYKDCPFRNGSLIGAFKKTPDLKSGDELNAHMSSSLRRKTADFQSAENVIRPCSEEIYKNNPTCIGNVQKDPLLAEFENISVQASMDNLMNHQAEVSSGKRPVAIVERGVVTLLSKTVNLFLP